MSPAEEFPGYYRYNPRLPGPARNRYEQRDRELWRAVLDAQERQDIEAYERAVSARCNHRASSFQRIHDQFCMLCLNNGQGLLFQVDQPTRREASKQ